MFRVLDLYQLDIEDMQQTETKLLQETECAITHRFRQLVYLPVTVENDVVESLWPPDEEPQIGWVGDPRFKVYPEESSDSYVRQLVDAATQFMVEELSVYYMEAGNGRLPSEEIVWQSYMRWRKTAQQTFYFDSDFDEVTLPMIHAWAKRQLFHLHHLGARPVYQQISWSSGRGDKLSLNMRYAAYFLLSLVLENLRI